MEVDPMLLSIALGLISIELKLHNGIVMDLKSKSRWKMEEFAKAQGDCSADPSKHGFKEFFIFH